MAKVKAAAAENERALGFAERRVEACVGELVSGSIDGVIAATKALADQLDGRRSVLRFLAHLAPIGSEAGRRASMALPSGEPCKMDHPELRPWQAAIDELHRRSDAKLPE